MKRSSSPIRFGALLTLAATFALIVAGCGNKDEAASSNAVASAGNAAAAPQAGSTPYPGMQGAKLVVPGDKAKKQ